MSSFLRHDDLKEMLDSNKDSLKLEAMKRIVAVSRNNVYSGMEPICRCGCMSREGVRHVLNVKQQMSFWIRQLQVCSLYWWLSSYNTPTVLGFMTTLGAGTARVFVPKPHAHLHIHHPCRTEKVKGEGPCRLADLCVSVSSADDRQR